MVDDVFCFDGQLSHKNCIKFMKHRAVVWFQLEAANMKTFIDMWGLRDTAKAIFICGKDFTVAGVDDYFDDVFKGLKT